MYSLDILPYDETVLIVHENGNMQLQVWYDCSREAFIGTWGQESMVVGWAPTPLTRFE